MPEHAGAAERVPVSWYLILSAVLFTLGWPASAAPQRHHVFMCIELMLNAVI